MTAVLQARDVEPDTAIVARPRRRRRNVVPNVLGAVVFLIAAFPVYWMVLTSFRRGADILKACLLYTSPSPRD